MTVAPTSPFARRLGVLAALGLGATALVAAPVPDSGDSLEVARVVGPNSCAECHVEEFEAWEASAHHAESKLLTRNAKAQKIARALGVRRIKSDTRCTSCHFTLQGEHAADAKAVAGVSCESCHGGARDWLDLHDDFGDAAATAATESDDHRARRETRCDEAGMVRPREVHQLAERCFVCHTVADPELIAAGHPTGAGFELVAWSQGEVRHNFVRGGGTENAVASVEHRRVLYVIGQMLELKHAALALAAAPDAGAEFVDAQTARADGAADRLRAIAERAMVKEVDVVLETLGRTPFSAGMDAHALVEAVEECARMFRRNATPEALAGIDALLPDEDTFVGAPAR